MKCQILNIILRYNCLSTAADIYTLDFKDKKISKDKSRITLYVSTCQLLVLVDELLGHKLHYIYVTFVHFTYCRLYLGIYTICVLKAGCSLTAVGFIIGCWCGRVCHMIIFRSDFCLLLKPLK